MAAAEPRGRAIDQPGGRGASRSSGRSSSSSSGSSRGSSANDLVVLPTHLPSAPSGPAPHHRGASCSPGPPQRPGLSEQQPHLRYRRASAPDLGAPGLSGHLAPAIMPLDDDTAALEGEVSVVGPLIATRMCRRHSEAAPVAASRASSRASSRRTARGGSCSTDDEQGSRTKGSPDLHLETMSAGEWAARLLCTSASERREATVALVSRIEASLTSGVLESLEKVKIADMLEEEIESRQQAVSLQSFHLVKGDFLELKALREEKEEFENRMMVMNNTYLREITSKRDVTRTGCEIAFETLSKEGFVGGDVQFFEPLQHLSNEARQCVLSILEEKLKAIFEWNPEMKEKTSKFELAKFEDGLLRERLASYTRLNAQLREELRDLRQRAKQAELGNQKSSWEHQKAEAQSGQLKKKLERTQQELDEALSEAEYLRQRLAKAAEAALQRQPQREEEEAEGKGEGERKEQKEGGGQPLPMPVAPKPGVARGVQTDATPTPPLSRVNTTDGDLAACMLPAGKPPSRHRRRSGVGEVLQLSDEADKIDDAMEKRLHQAERQAELATKALHQRDELIQSLNSRLEALKAARAAEPAPGCGCEAGGPAGEAPEAGASGAGGAAVAAERSASHAAPEGSAEPPSSGPAPGAPAAAAAAGGALAAAAPAACSGGGAAQSDVAGIAGSALAAGSQAQPRRVAAGAAREGSPEEAQVVEGSKEQAHVVEAQAQVRADFANSIVASLREELQASREEVAAAEERLQAAAAGGESSAGIVQLEAESRARKAACDELESCKASLGLAQSRIRVLEAALGAQTLDSSAISEDEEELDEKREHVSTELGNMATRAAAATQFKARAALEDQKTALRSKVRAQKAQLGSILQENTVLHLALEEVQREMHSLTSRLRKRIPESQGRKVDVESVLKRMEKVAASGVGGYIRLHKQAQLRQVAAVAQAGEARADARAPEEGTPPPEGPAQKRGHGTPAESESTFARTISCESHSSSAAAPAVLSAVSFTQFGATEVPMARAGAAAPSGAATARANPLKYRSQPLRSAREPGAAALADLQAAGLAFQPLASRTRAESLGHRVCSGDLELPSPSTARLPGHFPQRGALERSFREPPSPRRQERGGGVTKLPVLGVPLLQDAVTRSPSESLSLRL